MNRFGLESLLLKAKAALEEHAQKGTMSRRRLLQIAAVCGLVGCTTHFSESTNSEEQLDPDEQELYVEEWSGRLGTVYTLLDTYGVQLARYTFSDSLQYLMRWTDIFNATNYPQQEPPNILAYLNHLSESLGLVVTLPTDKVTVLGTGPYIYDSYTIALNEFGGLRIESSLGVSNNPDIFPTLSNYEPDWFTHTPLNRSTVELVLDPSHLSGGEVTSDLEPIARFHTTISRLIGLYPTMPAELKTELYYWQGLAKLTNSGLVQILLPSKQVLQFLVEHYYDQSICKWLLDSTTATAIDGASSEHFLSFGGMVFLEETKQMKMCNGGLFFAHVLLGLEKIDRGIMTTPVCFNKEEWDNKFRTLRIKYTENTSSQSYDRDSKTVEFQDAQGMIVVYVVPDETDPNSKVEVWFSGNQGSNYWGATYERIFTKYPKARIFLVDQNFLDAMVAYDGDLDNKNGETRHHRIRSFGPANHNVTERLDPYDGRAILFRARMIIPIAYLPNES